jgi:hypothetical protein
MCYMSACCLKTRLLAAGALFVQSMCRAGASMPRTSAGRRLTGRLSKAPYRCAPYRQALTAEPLVSANGCMPMLGGPERACSYLWAAAGAPQRAPQRAALAVWTPLTLRSSEELVGVTLLTLVISYLVSHT